MKNKNYLIFLKYKQWIKSLIKNNLQLNFMIYNWSSIQLNLCWFHNCSAIELILK